MKAITIMQPYATLIMLGVKRFETRPAPPNGDMRPDGVRGLPGLAINAGERIAIHAGTATTVKRRTRQVFGDYEVENDTGRRGDPQLLLRGDKLAWPYRLPMGALLGTVEVTRALPINTGADVEISAWTDLNNTVRDLEVCTLIGFTEAPNGALRADYEYDDLDDQIPYGDWQPGRWAWELANVERFDRPIPVKGKQGVWEVTL